MTDQKPLADQVNLVVHLTLGLFLLGGLCMALVVIEPWLVAITLPVQCTAIWYFIGRASDLWDAAHDVDVWRFDD